MLKKSQAMLVQICCLAQGNNILLPGFKSFTSVSKIDILANRPICSNKSLLVSRVFKPTDWSNVFDDCIHVAFCRPLGLVTSFNAICNACLAGVPSSSLRMCQINLSLFCLFYQSIND